MKEIYQVDDKFKLVHKWNSINEISKELNISSSTICKALKKDNNYAMGFYWCDNWEEGWRPLKVKSKKIYQVDPLTFKIIRTWKTAAEVEKALRININSCLNGKSTTAGGFIWYRENQEINITFIVCEETNENFLSYSEAASAKNCNRLGISKCCEGKQQTAGGYHWSKKVFKGVGKNEK